MRDPVAVVGAGLAGSEAAWQLATRGIPVQLFEMKPLFRTPAHRTDGFAELVCSNSLRGAGLATAPGLLKEELRRCGSLIMAAADECAVPAGGALAVDRRRFSDLITARLHVHPLIEICPVRVDMLPEGDAVIATGPLTEGPLAEAIADLLGAPLHFYDAAAPIVAADSVDREQAYFCSRYDKGGADYLNCPLTKEEYTAFVAALREAREAPVHGFEDKAVFEGCMPAEVMARRGEDTLRFGPMKPVGLRDPRTGARPYAVLQLRAEDEKRTMYNLVGFQTHLLHSEQKRVFGLVPALRNADFLRYGIMHRNSFIDAPGRLDAFYRVIGRENLYFAGQITGVEGYIESAASGLCCGLDLARRRLKKAPAEFPRETAVGALRFHVAEGELGSYQPMNINFGIVAPLPERVRGKRERYLAVSERALSIIDGLLPILREDIK